jgi:DNA primase
MVAFTKESLGELLDNHNIIDILEKRIELTPAEGHYFSKCPFCGGIHSILIMEDMNSYFCFKCKAEGNAFIFLMEAFKMKFDEAIREIAAISGYEGLIEIDFTENEEQAKKNLEERFDRDLKMMEKVRDDYIINAANTQLLIELRNKFYKPDEYEEAVKNMSKNDSSKFSKLFEHLTKKLNNDIVG